MDYAMDILSNIPTGFIEKYYTTSFFAYAFIVLIFVTSMMKLGVTPKNLLEFKDYISGRRISTLKKCLTESTCEHEKAILNREINRLRKHQLTGISSEKIQKHTTLILVENELPMVFFKTVNTYMFINEQDRVIVRLSKVDKFFRWFFRIIGAIALMFGFYMICIPLIFSIPPIQTPLFVIFGCLIGFYGIFFCQVIPSQRRIKKVNGEIEKYYNNSGNL